MLTEVPAMVKLTTRPDAAVLFRRPGGVVTAAEFVAAARGMAARMPPGGHLINLCRDRYHFAVGFAAAVLAGRVSLMTADTSPARLAELAAQFPDALVLADDAAAAPGLPHLLIDLTPDAGPVPAIPADRPAAIVFTSGSTGTPVGHHKVWGSLAQRNAAGGVAFGMRAEAPAEILGTVPPQHMYGFETTVLLPLHAPCASWCGPSFYPQDIRHGLEALAAPRVLVTTPLQMGALLRAGTALPPIAMVISATAPLPADQAAEAEGRWGTEVHEIYGATEVGSIASRRTVGGPDWTLYPGVTFHPEGEDIIVRAPAAISHALNDVIDRQEDGRFRLVGRRADMVKLAGKRTSLAGLNKVLTGIDGVKDGVFITPADLDTRPTARLLVFAVAPTRSAEDILAELRRRIEPAFLPRRVVLVDALPRNDMGKLPVQQLRALEPSA